MGHNVVRKLSILQRLSLVSLFFACTLIFSAWVAVTAVNADVSIAKRELDGDAYLSQLSKVLVEVSIHRTHARRFLAGDEETKEAVAKAQQKVDAAFEGLIKVDASLTDVLGTGYSDLAKRNRQSARPLLLKQAWKEIIDKFGTKDFTPTASDDLHNRLIADIRALYTHVGDQSTLILDPELDTYYNMDAFLLRFPEIVERLSLLKDLAQEALKKPSVELADRSRIAEATAMLDFHNRTLKADIDAVIVEAPQFSQLDPLQSRELVDKARVATETIGKVVDDSRRGFLQNDGATANGSEFETQTTDALEAISDFQTESIRQQDVMLGIRLSKLKAQSWRHTATLVVLAGVTALWAFFSVRSITRPLRELAGVARKISRGNMPDSVEVGTSSDELAVLARALNDVAKHVKLTGLAALRPSSAGFARGVTNALQMSVESDGGITRVFLEGEISDEARFEDLGPLQGSVAFDLSGIKRINTHGVREWMNFVGTLSNDLTITYERCSPVFVGQANRTAGFLKHGKIVSFAAPYFCETCGTSIEVMLDAKADFAGPPHKAPDRECAACKTALRFDDVEDTYLAFLTN